MTTQNPHNSALDMNNENSVETQEKQGIPIETQEEKSEIPDETQKDQCIFYTDYDIYGNCIECTESGVFYCK